MLQNSFLRARKFTENKSRLHKLYELRAESQQQEDMLGVQTTFHIIGMYFYNC